MTEFTLKDAPTPVAARAQAAVPTAPFASEIILAAAPTPVVPPADPVPLPPAEVPVPAIPAQVPAAPLVASQSRPAPRVLFFTASGAPSVPADPLAALVLRRAIFIAIRAPKAGPAAGTDAAMDAHLAMPVGAITYVPLRHSAGLSPPH